MAEMIISNANFEEEVLESDKPVLLDFWATWCGPCQLLSPVIAELAAEHPEIKVGKVNVDDEPELADAFNVTSIPLVVLMNGAKVVKSSLGYVTKDKLEELLK